MAMNKHGATSLAHLGDIMDAKSRTCPSCGWKVPEDYGYDFCESCAEPLVKP